MRSRVLLVILFAALLVGSALYFTRAKEARPSRATAPEAAESPEPGLSQAGSEVASSNSPAGRLSDEEAAKAAIRQRLKAWAATRTEDEEERRLLLLEMKSVLTDENAGALTRMLSTEDLLGPFGLVAFDRWLGVEPLAASRWVAQQPGVTAEQARYAANHLLNDPVLLNQYCEGMPDTAWRQTFLAEASMLDADKNPARAVSLAQRMKADADRLNALETASYSWMLADLPAAMRWVETLQDRDLRARVLAMGAKALASTDHDLAASWLSAAVMSDSAKRETALSLVETWAQSDPRSAARWLVSDLDVKARQPAVLAVARVWQRADPAQAEAWLASLPEQAELRDLLAAEVAEANSPKD